MELRPILSTLRRHKFTAWLLVLEIALTCAIVCNAVFLISQRLHRMDLPSGIAERELVQIQLGHIGKNPDAKAQTETDLAALRQIAGVKQAGLTEELPFSFGGSSNSGLMLEPRQQQPTVTVSQYMGQNILPTLGLRLVAGRDFQPGEYVDLDIALAALKTGDTKGLPQSMIVTRALADRLWPGKAPLGQTAYVGKGIPLRVIGVVESLARPNMLNKGPQYTVVWPIHMTSADGADYVLRTAPQDRAAVLEAAVAKLKQIDPNRVVLVKRTYDQARREFFANDRAMAGILVGVIVALLTVTALGIVGLASFWVGQRRRSIGVRRALGATRGDILRYFQTENFLLATLGIVLGMVLAYGINLFLMLHYELPRLPGIYLPVGALVLWAIGQLAVLGPALRAAAVPPVVATRSV
ncbi:MAG: ABC transporter permease [Rhodanobacter sp. 68-29]|uniref:ABC transporter permease n=1 Tax=Rhodanobacter sp. PCA2 TaxID=2006117 RepID=UPI00086B6EF5|nr:FtsX-like permease family protein [Rhodanobacter sp. PCA2]MBA2077617.1 ABC transporter permease [Rhodanobacter sp. PCA2]MBN8922571.1 FtsX-like permease family protein [Rhodanobacter sp.]ODU76217.1 MAG: ABC transporter permease [Rhodanobacter sp. SCN 69-32]OJY62435.1 MAG: ABC transporter permease [Rhodanobacter sp. 68-29]